MSVLLFVGAIAAIYLAAATIIVRWLLRRLGVIDAPVGPRPRMLPALVLGVAVVGVLCMAYGYFIEPYWPEVTQVQLKSAKLPQGTRPIRIVHISDIHSDPTQRLEHRLPSIIAAERPDIIAFTGDSINSEEGLPVLKSLLTNLATIAPTFAVRGNWDTWFWREIPLFEGTGVQELNGKGIAIEVAGAPLWITGLAVGDEARLAGAVDSAPVGAVKVFLYHLPDLVREVAQKQVDIYLAGHTHGGQVALPFYGALITFSKFGKRYESGLYREGNTWLYVNRGIGMEGGAGPRVRFLSRPEVTVIEIAPED